MGREKRNGETPRARIYAGLRKIWLFSKERSAALKAYNYTCASCGRKHTTRKGEEVKVEVHHKEGVLNWDIIVNSIREQLLCSVDKLEVLCKECHKEEEKKKKNR